MSNVEPIAQQSRLPFLTSHSDIEGIRQENAHLKDLVVRLSAIIAKNIVAQK
jgi:hypothetical protein